MEATANNAYALLMLVFLATLIPLVGIFLAITPYLMKKSECFAVTVPEQAIHDPYLKGLKKRYLIIMFCVTAALTMPCLISSFSENEYFPFIMTAGIILVTLVSFTLMLYFRSKVRAYKRKQGWTTRRQSAVAAVSDEEAPRAISLKWNLLAVPLVALTLAIGYTGYPSMPDLIAMQVGFDGQVTSSMAKSEAAIWLPVLIQTFLVLILTGSHWMILRSRRSLNPSAPATSALAYGLFARAQTIYLVALNVIFCALMILMPLSFMGTISLMQAAAFIIIAALVMVLGAVAIAVVYGQGGSRVFARMQSSGTLTADEDEHWKLGVFYFNREDSSLFLLERFGIGWTFNFARPAVWAIIIGLIVVMAAFIGVVFTLM